MKTRRTIFLSLGIFAVMILAILSSYVDESLMLWNAKHWTPYMMLAGITAMNLILAAAFCTAVWFILGPSAGDRIPPVVMLVLGLAGLITAFLYPYLPLGIASQFLPDTPAAFACALFIVSGMTGLLVKPNPS
jgi:hypothetical protein